jgi:GNAT superfamily N-acetyltransferase
MFCEHVAGRRLAIDAAAHNIRAGVVNSRGGTHEGYDMAPVSERPIPGVIRQLRPSDLLRFRDHLLRLDPSSRHDRFNGGIGDAFVAAYAERSLARGTTVIGYLEGDEIRGAAEIHECAGHDEPTAEIAFSVEPQLQGRGIGALLFERLLAHARAMGYRHLRVTTHPGNDRMRRLARKFQARLSFQAGEAVGVIALDPLPPVAETRGQPWWPLRMLGFGRGAPVASTRAIGR